MIDVDTKTFSLDACITLMAVCAGTSDKQATKTSRDAIHEFLASAPRTKSDEMLALMDLYDRFDDMMLSGRTADAMRETIETELDIAFLGERDPSRV